MNIINTQFPAIPSISSINNETSVGNSGQFADEIGSTFEDILQQLSSSEKTSDSLLTQLAAGEDVDIHDVLIAVEETDINFRIAMSIRDKLVDAYSEIMRMSI